MPGGLTDAQTGHPGASGGYRPDIDGLRAIAILSVVIFHAFPSFVGGGFVGVDVFFVISGFLISSIIFTDLERGTFSFSGFYSRRIKRIFPALILVLLTCYLVGRFLLLPDEFNQLVKHIAAATAFVQNFVLMDEAGYFDRASELKPLMHLWSLAVEEQFYVLFPFLVWIAYRIRLEVALAVLALGGWSFWINVNNIAGNPVKTFFSPESRFWELLAGSILAYATIFGFSRAAANRAGCLEHEPSAYGASAWRHGAKIRDVLSLLGLTLIVWAIVGLDNKVPFPGWRAVPPVLGAVLLIAAGPLAVVNRTILASRFMVGVGLISYPLYLWHWPLLAFPRIADLHQFSLGERMGAVALSFLLAWLTYRFWERPIRFGRGGQLKTVALAASTFAIGLFALSSYLHSDLALHDKELAQFNSYFDAYPRQHDLAGKFREQCNFYDGDHPDQSPKAAIARECTISRSTKSIMLWGDSHAQHLYYGLREALPEAISILQVTTSSCPPSVHEVVPDMYHSCNKSNAVAIETIRSAKPEVVILAQVGGHEQTDYLEMQRFLVGLGVKRIILVGPVPQWTSDLRRIFARDAALFQEKPERLSRNLQREPFATDKILKARYADADGLVYISPLELFCNAAGCLTRLGGDLKEGLVTFDYGHLTPRMSKWVAEQLLAPRIVAYFDGPS